MSARRREGGIALIMVLVIGLLLTTVMAALTRRSIIDSRIARNRDSIAQADALARGGLELARALLVAEAVAGDGPAGNPTERDPDQHSLDLSRLGSIALTPAPGVSLSLRIEEPGSKLNLNALVDYADPNARIQEEAVEFLRAFLLKVIDESIHPGERGLYDERELAENLLDYVDRDDVRYGGGSEDDYYQAQRPPYRAANMPLLTVDEIGMVEGFTPQLVEAIRPYVTVHPMAGGGGINLNTAPSHVLATVYHGTGSGASRQLANEDEVRSILMARQEDKILCNETGSDDRCILPSEVGLSSIYPPPDLSQRSEVYTVVAEATVGEIRRSIEAVIDRSELSAPVVLSQRLR